MEQRWNDRYKDAAYAYGKAPNEFLKQQIDKLSPCSIVFPAEGEGRNAVYAASKGFNVSAFDISIEGKHKAMRLAETRQVTIDYQVGTLENLNFQAEQFEAMALIYAHFPAALKSGIHKALVKLLKPNAIVIFEAFSKKHLEYVTRNPEVGGPKELDMLFSIEELQEDFKDFDFLEINELEIALSEGVYHNGLGSVIRFVARKK